MDVFMWASVVDYMLVLMYEGEANTQLYEASVTSPAIDVQFTSCLQFTYFLTLNASLSASIIGEYEMEIFNSGLTRPNLLIVIQIYMLITDVQNFNITSGNLI